MQENLGDREFVDFLCQATDWLFGKLDPIEADRVGKELADPNSKISRAINEINEAVRPLRNERADNGEEKPSEMSAEDSQRRRIVSRRDQNTEEKGGGR